MNKSLISKLKSLENWKKKLLNCKKEAESNLVNSNAENLAEISIIDEQIIIVDGKRKKKKKKKKKRKKIGGGEETIANITIGEVDEEEESETNQIELNPLQKKKKKHKKIPNTELNPVEEDSKEQSTLMDMKALASIDSQHIHNIEEVNEELEGQSRRSNKKIETLSNK